MADFNIAINLKANDLGTAQIIQGLRGNLAGLNDGFDVTGRQGAKGMAALAGGLNSAASSVNNLTAKARGVLDPIIQEGVSFERSMAEVLAFGGSKFAPFMDKLHEQARQLGRDTEFTAVQAAASMRQLAQAGLDPTEIMGQLPTIMDLAKAGALELEPAAKIVASTMAQFGMETSEAANVADILAKTANSTQTNVREIGQALGFAGTTADMLGLSLEQTATLLGALGKTAITSGKAGRWLDGMFLGLAKLTSPDMRKGLKEIGVDQKELIANMNKGDVAAVAKQLAEGFAKKGLSAERQLDVLSKIFGRQGGRAIAALMKTVETGKFDEVAAEIHDFSGAAKQMGDIMSDTAKGDILRAQSALSELKLTIADELLPAMRPLLVDLTEAAKGFAAWAKENPETVRTLGMLAMKGLALGTVLGPLLSTAGSLVGLIAALGKVSGVTASGGLLKLANQSGTLGKNLTSMVGSKAGMLGMLGAVGAAALLGAEIGMWLDDTFHLSDALAGVNKQLGVFNGLAGRKVAGPVSFLGDLTEDERKQLKSLEGERDALIAEIEQFEGSVTDWMAGADASFFGISMGRGSDVMTEELDQKLKAIDAIHAEGVKRRKDRDREATEQAQAAAASAAPGAQQVDRTDELIQAISARNFGTAVTVKVDSSGRLLGIEGDESGVINGTMFEGL